MRTLTLSALLSALTLLIPATDSYAAAEVQGTINDAQVSGGDGANLAAGSGVQTGDSSQMQVQMDGGQVRFGEKTQAVLNDAKNNLDLSTGVMLVSSGQGLGRKGINVNTNEYKVTARGTALVGYKPGAYMKVTCIEGTVRIALRGLVGEFITLGPGQQLVALATEDRLPEPVEVDLKVLTETSGLITNGELPGLSSQNKIDDSVNTQQDALASGSLQATPFYLEDMSLDVQADLDTRLSQASDGGNAASFERLGSIDQSESFFAKVGRALRPSFLRDSDTAVLQSPDTVTLSGEQQVDQVVANAAGGGFSENSAIIGSAQDFNIGNGTPAKITNNRDLQYLEFFAGNDLTLKKNSSIDVSSNSSTRLVDNDGNTTTTTEKQGGLLLFAQNILGVFGNITNQTGAVNLYGVNQVDVNGSEIMAAQGVTVAGDGQINIQNSTFTSGGGDLITEVYRDYFGSGTETEQRKFFVYNTSGTTTINNTNFIATDNPSNLEDTAQLGMEIGPDDGPFSGRILNLANLVFRNLDTVNMNGDTINVNGPLEFDGAAARFRASRTVNLPNGFTYNGHNFGIQVGVSDDNGNYRSGEGLNISGANLTAGRTKADSNFGDLTRGDDTNYNDVLIHAGSQKNATLKINSSTLKVLANSAPSSWVWIAGYGNTSVDISNSTLQNMLANNGGNIEIYSDRNVNILNSIFQARDAINIVSGGDIFMQGNQLSSQSYIDIIANNNLIFSGNNVLNAPYVYLDANTIQVNNGGNVTSNGMIETNANHHNYNYPGFGNMTDMGGPVP